jgi:hypothetical protein
LDSPPWEGCQVFEVWHLVHTTGFYKWKEQPRSTFGKKKTLKKLSKTLPYLFQSDSCAGYSVEQVQIEKYIGDPMIYVG